MCIRDRSRKASENPSASARRPPEDTAGCRLLYGCLTLPAPRTGLTAHVVSPAPPSAFAVFLLFKSVKTASSFKVCARRIHPTVGPSALSPRWPCQDRRLAEEGRCLLYTSDAADDLLCVDLG